MTEKVPIARTLRIRDQGFDECWLHDQIIADPACLGLGELEPISHERLQPAGGRLDLLLKDPTDDTMYEVEVMLGETDESHIIRTIEYWDNEKRKWPQRQHFAVLVAETITRRFFNVIQLFSHALPIIAIQASLVEANGQMVLHFVKVLDTYEEPEEEGATELETHDEAYWRTKAEWTLDTARALWEAVAPVSGSGSLRYVKNYIALTFDQTNRFWLQKRSGNMSLLEFWLPDDLIPEATALLDQKKISYIRKRDDIRLTIDEQTIRANAALFTEIAALVRKGWER
jgi:hypothetical protein